MTYTIQTESGLVQVEGEAVKIGDTPCAIRQEAISDKWGHYDEWTVTHLPSGMRICGDLDKDIVMVKAQDLLRRHDLPVIIARQKALLLERGHKWPVND